MKDARAHAFEKSTWDQFRTLPDDLQRDVFERLIGLIDVVADLESQLAKNSGKPPSSDGLKKPRRPLRVADVPSKESGS